jgi:hypothetical protein
VSCRAGGGNWGNPRREIKGREGIGDTKTGGEGDENVMAPVVRHGGVDVECAFFMSRPRLSLFSGVVDDDELSWGLNGVGGKVVGATVQAVPGGDRGI